MEQHFLHFNSRETVAAARAYEQHLAAGGKMLVSLAGAMSTAKIGQILSRMIHAGKVHAICCTGANLEEDLFNLLAYKEYEIIPDWRALSAQDEKRLYERGFNRVTDTCIPETIMRHMERRLMDRWKQACEKGERKFEAEFLWDLFRDGRMEEFYQIPKENSWFIAAQERGIPIWSPGCCWSSPAATANRTGSASAGWSGSRPTATARPSGGRSSPTPPCCCGSDGRCSTSPTAPKRCGRRWGRCAKRMPSATPSSPG